MSSAVRWRVSLLWKRSSTFKRGAVTFRPLLFSSRGSSIPENHTAVRYNARSISRVFAHALHRRTPLRVHRRRLRPPYRRAAGQLRYAGPGGSPQARHDESRGEGIARHAAPRRRLPWRAVGLLFQQRRGPALVGAGAAFRFLQGRKARLLLGQRKASRRIARAQPRRDAASPVARQMSVRVAIAGANGRMGRALLDAVSTSRDATLAASFDLGDDVRAALATADVLLDFTRPEGTPAPHKVG